MPQGFLLDIPNKMPMPNRAGTGIPVSTPSQNPLVHIILLSLNIREEIDKLKNVFTVEQKYAQALLHFFVIWCNMT